MIALQKRWISFRSKCILASILGIFLSAFLIISLVFNFDALVRYSAARAILVLERLAIHDATETGFRVHLTAHFENLLFSPSLTEVYGSLRSNRDIEYARLTLPAASGRRINVTQSAVITNEAEFAYFNQIMLSSETVQMYFHGNTSAVIGHRVVPIVLKNSLKIRGMNGPQIVVKNVTTSNDADQGLLAISELFSSSPVEIYLGHVTFALEYHDIAIAKVHGEVDIKHGNNIIDARGRMTLDGLIGDQELLASFGKESARHAVAARLQGVSAASNISWVNAIVRGIDRNITLPLEAL